MDKFLLKIDKTLKDTNYDEKFINASVHHMEVLTADDGLEKTVKKATDLLLSTMFLEKLDLYPSHTPKGQIDENAEWPVSPLPSEVFGNLKETIPFRRKKFFEYLKVGHVLDCQVISNILQTEYNLKVIHKYGVTRILDDLDIIVILNVTKAESRILQTKLLVSELIRVVVSGTREDEDEDDLIVNVTVNPQNIESPIEEMPILGRISEKDMPDYVLNHSIYDNYSTYSEYLLSKLILPNPNYGKEIMKNFPPAVCSYFSSINSLIYPDEETGQGYLKQSRLHNTKCMAEYARVKFEEKQYEESLSLIDKALQICPEDGRMKSILYELKSKIYAQKDPKPLCSEDYLKNLELAIAADPTNLDLKKKFSKILFKIGYRFNEMKQFKLAIRALEGAKKFDVHNEDVTYLLKDIEKEELVNTLKQKSMNDLNKEKKKLLDQLKKIQT